MSETSKDELESVSRGLAYLSASDAPVGRVELAGADARDPAPDRSGAVAGTPAGTRVEEQSLERFFCLPRGRRRRRPV